MIIFDILMIGSIISFMNNVDRKLENRNKKETLMDKFYIAMIFISLYIGGSFKKQKKNK